MDMRRLVGRNFGRIRKLRGLTQQDVEERSGFSQQYLSGLERGIRNPSIISLYEIAQVLEVSILDLLTGAPDARLVREEEPTGRLPHFVAQPPHSVEMEDEDPSVDPHATTEARRQRLESPEILFVLTDEQWRKLFLACESGGVPLSRGGDCRVFLEAVFWIARTGQSWRQLPKTYGNWNSIYRRYRDWAKAGIWQVLSDQGDLPIGFDGDKVIWLRSDASSLKGV